MLFSYGYILIYLIVNSSSQLTGVDPKLWGRRLGCHKVRSSHHIFSPFAPLRLEPLYRQLGYHTTNSPTILNYALRLSQKLIETLLHYPNVQTQSLAGMSRTTSCWTQRKLKALTVGTLANKLQTESIWWYGGFRIHYTFWQETGSIWNYTGQWFDVRRPHYMCCSGVQLLPAHSIPHTSAIFKDAINTIAWSIVGSRLDYCNAILYGITEANLNQLHHIPNSFDKNRLFSAIWWWWWWWRWSFRIPAGPGHLVCHPRWFLGLRLSPLMV